jgi:putative transposase
MKRVTGRQTRYVNAIEHRSGTLWEGRFRSSTIQRYAYLLACCRYVEITPVRAGLVAITRDYHWSSHRGRAGWGAQTPIDLDEGYLSLEAIPEGEWDQIREAK